jgi:hypothetical protein
MLTVRGRRTPLSADLLIYLAVVMVVWAVFAVFRHRRRAHGRRLGDAEAYEGNLIIPVAGSMHQPHRGQPHAVHESHGGHSVSHGDGHAGHIGGQAGHIGPGGHH